MNSEYIKVPEMTRNPLFLSENSCDKCTPGWILFNSSCYFFSSTESSTVKRNWHESRMDCVSRGSDLAVIDNQQEQVGWKYERRSLKTDKSSTYIIHRHTRRHWKWLAKILKCSLNAVKEVLCWHHLHPIANRGQFCKFCKFEMYFFLLT